MTAQAHKRHRARHPSIGGLALALAWWALLGGVWMLLVDTASTAEEVFAAVAALTGVVATRLVLVGDVDRMRPALSVLPTLVRQLARVPADLWLLAATLARALTGRRRPGRFHELELELPLNERGNGRRAAIELVGSLAPNTIVLGVDEHRVIVHQLVARHGERESVREIGS